MTFHQPNKDKAAQFGNRNNALLSIVVPVFNEEDAVGIFLREMEAVLATCRKIIGGEALTEIVFVDDGSTDQTIARILAHEGCGSIIRIVKLSRNFGKDPALAAGLVHAHGHAVVPMDVDLQDPPEILPRMVAAWISGEKVVNAVREDRGSDTWLKRHSAGTFYNVYNRISSYPLQPNVGDFRLLDREVVDILNSMPERIRFMKGLFSWLGFQPFNIEYQRQARSAGTTKWNFWSLWNFAIDGITASSTLPLRVWSYVGGGVAIIALIYSIFLFMRTLIYGVDVPGYSSLMVVLLTIGAVNMIALGIIGEYVGRIAIEVRQRPLYVVEDEQTAHERSLCTRNANGN
ncbi:MAG: glycosyltransferase family 2 protein [Hyphomicrobiales bacterium]|nr:glycosyltransferase family 2 protein [Hyphomicrobiales bacterium]